MSSKRTGFLRGVPASRVLEALERAAGSELASGKFDSPESSSALAVNTFAYFLEQPESLPVIPCLEDLDWPARRVDVEREMRFPWSGGKHPWLDAVIETGEHIVGVEAKRFEPFRDAKKVNFSPAYDRDVWGEQMEPFDMMRYALMDGLTRFSYLDAAQLVKHAYGLVTEGRRVGKRPVLLYLFAEPTERSGKPISTDAIKRHREEIADFARRISGAEVAFASSSYREWFAAWPRDLGGHRENLMAEFGP